MKLACLIYGHIWRNLGTLETKYIIYNARGLGINNPKRISVQGCEHCGKVKLEKK